MLTILVFIAAAFAQDPAASAAADGTSPSQVWTTESVELKRFPDADAVIVTFDAGQKLEVVVDDGATLRVRSGTDFGWIPADKVTHEQPTEAASPTFQLGDGPPKLQLNQ